MKPMFSRYAFFALVMFGVMLLVPEAKAQPYGSCGWCPCGSTCDGGWSMGVYGPYGSSPGNLTACPYPGLGCVAGQSGYCTGSDGLYYSYICENSGGAGGGGGGGGGGTTGVSPTLSYSCNATNSTATLSWSGGSTAGGQYALRINDTTAPPPPPASTWSGACPAASPDFCGDVTGSSRSMNVVLGRRYDAWIHSYDSMCGSFGCSYAPTAVPTSVSFVCSPPPPPAPVPDLYINGSNGPLSVASGTNLNLTWGSVANATSCTATSGVGWAGVPKSFNGGNENVPATLTSIYTLSCTGAGGTGTDSVVVNVNVPPPVTPPNPTGLTATCLAPNQVRLSWNPVIGFGVTGYAFRADYATPSWDGTCTSPDECSGIAASSYDKAVAPGITYGWWVHACNSAGCSPGISGSNFKCDYPASTISGRITNQATGAGIPGVVIPACAANPGAITDASGNYSFTVPYDARFCIRPNTPAGMNSNPLLSGLQPSQQAIHSYEWQVAGWNAGNHPYCDNYDSVNSTPAGCNEWTQWDIASGDSGYDFAYTSISAPVATLDVNPSVINIHPTANQKATLTWGSSGNVTSCSGTNFNTGGATSGTIQNLQPGSTTTYTALCTGPGGNSLPVSKTLTVISVCNPDSTCSGTRSNTCTDKKCTDVCGNRYDGTKDCREHWQEVAP